MARNVELNWEFSVIATVITDSAAMETASRLFPSDFTNENQIVWTEIVNLYSRNGTVDFRSLANALENCPDWQRVSPEKTPSDYLSEVLSFRGTNIEAYVNHVEENSTRKQLRRYAALIAVEAEDTNRPIEAIITSAENRILTLRRNRKADHMTMYDVIALFTERFNGMLSGTIRPAWEPDVQAIRDIVDYAEGEDFIVCAARPGDGKTAWSRYELYQFVARTGKPGAVLNYENSPLEYARYILALVTGIDSRKIKYPARLTENEKERIRAAAQHIAQVPLHIVSPKDRTVHAAAAEARRLVSQYGIEMLVVDYVQLINNGLDNRVSDLTLTTGELRKFALDYKVPVIANAQLSREIERRGVNSEPQLSDLRESGSLEQDATIIIVPRPNPRTTPAVLRYYPENYDDDGILMVDRPRVIPVNFYVLKNRNGKTGMSDPVSWYKHINKYQTLQRNSIPELEPEEE